MKVRPDLFVGVLPFVRTAEERSFVRAAASLGVTSAAVSKSVRKLEEDLGVRLLERTSRVVTLTREGEVFFARCQQAVLGVQGARAVVEGSRREPHGELSVTLPFVLAPFVVPHLGKLAAECPRLSFRIEIADRVARLSSENYDVAIRMGTLEDSSLVARPLRRTRWVTVAAPSYLARSAAPRHPDDLYGHNCLRFVLPNGKARAFTFASAHGTKQTTLAVEGNLTIDHGSALLDAAQAGMGVAQVLDFMVEEKLRAGTLVEVLSAHVAEGPSIHALTSVARAGSANARAFVKFLLGAFARSSVP